MSEQSKPYGYEIRAGLADVALVRYGATASDSMTLYKTGSEAAVRQWAMHQVRKVGSRSMQVVSIEALKPLSKTEYQEILRQNKGWVAIPEQRKGSV